MQAKKIFRNIIIAILSITIYNMYAIDNTYAADSITITLPSSSVDLAITPTSSGTFGTANVNVQVTTSGNKGYTLDMTAADVNLTRTAAVNGSTPTIPTITTSYAESNFPTGYWGYKMSGASNYSQVLSSQRIVDTDTSTANTAMSNVITFAAKLDNSKPAGSYTTTLTFLATAYPSATPLYDKVEALALQKGGGTSAATQSVADLQATITTANSGVYQYSSSIFGTASDVNNGYNIYYYRGILDSNLDGTNSTYGSNGDGVTWPNYVKLGDTCWRIFRTTASGGVKMIYNGSYSGGTTANSCANAQTNAQLTTAAFNDASATVAGTSYTGIQYRNMQSIGYTYTNKISAGSTASTAISNILGSSGNDTTTNTNNSIIKQYIESWYSTNMSSYTSMLEPNANYCADRTVYNDNSYAIANKLAESTTVVPYGTSGMTIYRFGAFARNMSTSQNPTLTCPRGIVDNYSTTTASGGNGQLNYPVALLTADEASFSGSGSSTATNGSAYHYNSFLRSGSTFWLLSPSSRDSSGRAVGFALGSGGNLGNGYVLDAHGVRPVVSISHETNVTGGTGTAADPWTVE